MFEAAMKQICQSSTQHFMLYAFVYLERVLFLTFRAPSGPQSEGETGQLFTPQFLKASLVIRYSPQTISVDHAPAPLVWRPKEAALFQMHFQKRKFSRSCRKVTHDLMTKVKHQISNEK